jgi:hypothetical protein
LPPHSQARAEVAGIARMMAAMASLMVFMCLFVLMAGWRKLFASVDQDGRYPNSVLLLNVAR